MGQKINEYSLERFAFGDDDYYDIDYWDGTEYQTAKIKGITIKNALSGGGAGDGNIYANDGTVTANRTLDGGSYELLLTNLGLLKISSTATGADNIEFEVKSQSGNKSFSIKDSATNISLFSVENGVVKINSQYGLPTGNGLAHQIVKTDGSGSWGYGVTKDDGTTVGIGTAPQSFAKLTIDDNAYNNMVHLTQDRPNSTALYVKQADNTATSGRNCCIKTVAVGVPGTNLVNTSIALGSDLIDTTQDVKGIQVYNTLEQTSDSYIGIDSYSSGKFNFQTGIRSRISDETYTSAIGVLGWIDYQSGSEWTAPNNKAVSGQITFAPGVTSLDQNGTFSCFSATAQNQSGLTVDNAICFHAYQMTTGLAGSVFGTVYGVKIESPQALAEGVINKHYGIWQGGSGSNYFNADTGIGLDPNNLSLLQIDANTTSKASIKLTPSSAVDVASPVDGDLWYNGTNLNFRNGTTTTDLLGGSTSGGGATNSIHSTNAGDVDLYDDGIVRIWLDDGSSDDIELEITNYGSSTSSTYHVSYTNFDGSSTDTNAVDLNESGATSVSTLDFDFGTDEIMKLRIWSPRLGLGAGSGSGFPFYEVTIIKSGSLYTGFPVITSVIKSTS
tara:strand:+ start:2920 stop:4761 length:1842 start_codon:yes stop_codon:yes gene_type:complete